MTRVIVPYAPGKLNPYVPRVLGAYGFQPRYWPLFDDDDYQLLMQQIWHNDEPVVIVEQDILPWPGAIEELLACPCAWGTYTYKANGGVGIRHMLGCAKLTPCLMRSLPDLWDEWTHWSMIDQKLFFAAQARRIEPHMHRPAVVHLNEAELG